ncbi:MAG: AMP-binding protein [Leptospiraceae bacterium]|nr:AMP-binding protein [Leptospiraceae bacterium]MCP5500434.1 AMP-binding protein [Leptospiraceae bacterium]
MDEKIYYLLERTADRFPNKEAFLKRQEKEFKGRTFRELKTATDELIAGFIAEGIGIGEKIIFFCDSSTNWLLVDFSIICSGAVSVPRGTDVTRDDIVYIINHSESKIAIVQKEKDRQRLLSFQKETPDLKKIFILENEDGTLAKGMGTISELIEKGSFALKAEPELVQKRLETTKATDLATLIYTSGTTGAPKGVMLNQEGWIIGITKVIERTGLSSEDTGMSLLPPWHAFERAIEYAVIMLGISLVITDSKNLKEDLALFRPTLFPSVPRIWEALYNGIMAKVKRESSTKQAIFNFALHIGELWAKEKARFFGYEYSIVQPSVSSRMNKKISSGLKLIFLLPLKGISNIVFKPIHKALGGRLRISVSAGSALPGVVDRFLTALGLTVLEGYGMTETSAVISIRNAASPTPGTLGTVLSGYEIKLKNEIGEDITEKIGSMGTLWVKSKQILMGYFKRPDLNETCFDKDGYFCTGDLISLNWKKELQFSGRSKDTLVLAGGENVEPLPIEDKLLESEYIDQVMVLGNEKKTLSVIIVPNYERVMEKVTTVGNNYTSWNDNVELRKLFKTIISEQISHKNGFKSFEHIPGNCFYISPRNFDLDTEMTRTLKMKRNVILESFKKEVEQIY